MDPGIHGKCPRVLQPPVSLAAHHNHPGDAGKFQRIGDITGNPERRYFPLFRSTLSKKCNIRFSCRLGQEGNCGDRQHDGNKIGEKQFTKCHGCLFGVHLPHFKYANIEKLSLQFAYFAHQEILN